MTVKILNKIIPFSEVKPGDVFVGNISGSPYIKIYTNSDEYLTNEKTGEIGNALNLDNGLINFFSQSVPVVSVKAELFIER